MLEIVLPRGHLHFYLSLALPLSVHLSLYLSINTSFYLYACFLIQLRSTYLSILNEWTYHVFIKTMSGVGIKGCQGKYQGVRSLEDKGKQNVNCNMPTLSNTPGWLTTYSQKSARGGLHRLSNSRFSNVILVSCYLPGWDYSKLRYW